ncbi:MAG TPA: hypothetical protein VL334_07320 [Anaerolineae bacterium]|nr:hypothetical protein [Anaerolineae bacterium]
MSYLVAPIDALTSAIYSILIVLTFTLAFTVIKRWPGYEEPIPEGFGTELFFAVLGATVAWALIDALLPLWLWRNDPLVALRVSNIVSFIILFTLAYRWGRYTGANPWKIGALLVLAGVLLTAIAIPLGG